MIAPVPTPPLWDTDESVKADDSLHRKRLQGILEAALAKALNRRIEGTMTQNDWQQLEAAIASLETAGQVTIQAINAVIGNQVDAATIKTGTQRILAVVDSMLQTAKSLTGSVIGSATGTTGTAATGATGAT
jgi:hypothetical protein